MSVMTSIYWYSAGAAVPAPEVQAKPVPPLKAVEA
jgi:hypothetical protein